MNWKSKGAAPIFVIAVIAAALFFHANLFAAIHFSSLEPGSDLSNDLQAFAAIEPIDTHVHAFKTDPGFAAVIARLNLHVLDITVPDSQGIYGDLAAELARAKNFVQANPGHASLCVTFDPFKFNEKDFAANTVNQLRQEFADGAIAVKIWKNIGMELKTPDGKYVMPDDTALQPIYREIQAENKTLIAHVAEPSSCWEPPNPDSPDYDYYKENPEWYMYRHPDHPRKETILAARDHLLAENPKLRVVGAHLGSMEVDVDEMAKRFDRYPNFAVDTAARVAYLALQPREKVRAFLVKYQDRVLYGTDLEFGRKGDSGSQQEWESTCLRDWRFFSTNETVEFQGRRVQGLQLPDSVLRKLYHDNAIHWIPKMTNPAQK